MSRNKVIKVVVKISAFPYPSETFIIEFLRHLESLEISFVVIVDKLNRSYFLNSVVSQFNSIPRIEKFDMRMPKSVILRTLKFCYLLGCHRRDLNQLFRYYKIKGKFKFQWLFEWNYYMKFKEFDLFHIQFGTSKYPLDELKSVGFPPKLVCTFHGHDAFFPINKWIYNKSYYSRLISNISAVISNSCYLKEQLLDIGFHSEKIQIMPVSVSDKFFSYQKQTKKYGNDICFIALGSLSKLKGHEYAIRCINVLIKKGFNVNLSIVGEGPQRNSLENLVMLLGLKKYVNFLGHIRHDLLPEILLQSDVFLHTSIKDDNFPWEETQGLAIVEAMAVGLPVICFDSGGVKENFVNEESGFLCEPKNYHKMAEIAQILIENSIIRQNVGKNARHAAQTKLSSALYRSSLMSVYKKVLNQSES